MTLVEFIGGLDGQTIYINADKIVALQRAVSKDGPVLGVTAIVMEGGMIMNVKGTPEQSAETIEKQTPQFVKWTPKGEGMQ